MNQTTFDRREFITRVAKSTAGLAVGGPWLFAKGDRSTDEVYTEPLFDWSPWERYRDSMPHPGLTIKERDLQYARENIQRYDWARNYASNIERTVRFYLKHIDTDFLDNLIEETTPGYTLWTPCPSCRDQGYPVHPHGLWNWDIMDPEVLTCRQCGTVFPNAHYPEDVALHASWGTAQTITYYGGEPFEMFGFKAGRPSFTANIRARKVQWAASYSRMLAEAYALTGTPEFALACRKILLRFAACFPNWLVHVGYGEYADMDPKIASLHINDLPEPELTPPPNEPDYSLWTGYWSAGRAIGRGYDSEFVRKVVEAYDLSCTAKDKGGKAIYSEADRIVIERDLLLESTILLVCDKEINNKSISNRTAVGMVGMCVGHPGMVRFGLEGFDRAINEWFLSDGTSSESSFYGLMTLGGIWDMAQAARGYSDPPGFEEESGRRIDSLDLYSDNQYEQVWEAFFQGLQGDLRYPPYADAFPASGGLDASYVELMVAHYPKRKKYLALLKQLCGQRLGLPSGPVPASYYEQDQERLELLTMTFPYDLAQPNTPSSISLYYRSPDLADKKSGQLRFKDWNPPALRIGHIRTGTDGRESLLLLNASHWGNHHHKDSLNLYYWKNGHELLSDLGYLWDHPQEFKTSRVLAHNTVVIDGQDQRGDGRGGTMHFFKTSNHVKVMEASSEAYAQATMYRRTCALIDHGKGRNYMVDVFRVQGGDRQDYVIHLNNLEVDVSGLTLQPVASEQLYDFDGIRKGQSQEPWNLKWNAGTNMRGQAWMIGQPGEECYLAEGWGQRDWQNSDEGTRIPYVVRRCEGGGLKTFVSVFEGFDPDEPFVRDVRFNESTGVLTVDTAIGCDYVMSALDESILKIPAAGKNNTIKAHFGAASVQEGKLAWKFTG
ncbi:Heparinase II/III-like protein [Fodinibius roseus]|uniref:Heparinase II/III-like protein n=1 Tax=Fodinibius roseus TaxID=1194090 RepID=A0A1M4ZE90_9BACT|nr:heparinase II/III family protein [Fodinibius roseus]SHF16127.1 Heparinase II/III-like protein [Fodinibius roseus]